MFCVRKLLNACHIDYIYSWASAVKSKVGGGARPPWKIIKIRCEAAKLKTFSRPCRHEPCFLQECCLHQLLFLVFPFLSVFRSLCHSHPLASECLNGFTSWKPVCCCVLFRWVTKANLLSRTYFEPGRLLVRSRIFAAWPMRQQPYVSGWWASTQAPKELSPGR